MSQEKYRRGECDGLTSLPTIARNSANGLPEEDESCEDHAPSQDADEAESCMAIQPAGVTNERR